MPLVVQWSELLHETITKASRVDGKELAKTESTARRKGYCCRCIWKRWSWQKHYIRYDLKFQFSDDLRFTDFPFVRSKSSGYTSSNGMINNIFIANISIELLLLI